MKPIPGELFHEWQMRRNLLMKDTLKMYYSWTDAYATNGPTDKGFINWLTSILKWYT